MTLPPCRGPAGLAWRCDVCKRTSLWTDNHCVHGKLKDEDEGRWERLVVTCSEACRAAVPEENPRRVLAS